MRQREAEEDGIMIRKAKQTQNMTTLTNLINRKPDNFWRGEKFTFGNESSHHEAKIIFTKERIIYLSSSIDIDAGKTPPEKSKAEIKITQLNGNFKISKGEFKGGKATNHIYTASTFLNSSEKDNLFKVQEWRKLRFTKRKIRQDANIFNPKEEQESDILFQLTGNKAWKHVAMTEGRIEDLPSWAQAKDKLDELGFDATLQDQYLGYTDNFKVVNLFSQSTKTSPSDSQALTIKAPSIFKKKYADKITNFNPSTDTLEIDTDSFGIESSATFAAAKNKKKLKKLAKKDFDFLYDQKKGGLYFNENGADKGFGDGGIIAILKGAPDLTSGNLEFA